MRIALHTPVGVIVHTGDFKVDYTPIDDEIMDLGRLAELGRKGVLCLLADSTNAEHAGYTMSERTVGETFNAYFAKAAGRIIVAMFASNVHRIQQVVDLAGAVPAQGLPRRAQHDQCGAGSHAAGGIAHS